jgi:hypothetical protein
MSIHVRSTPNTGHKFNVMVPVAKCHEPTYAVQQITAYSITSSATLSSVGGTVRPSDLAVW